jgi:hypothetical protein
LLRFLNKLKFSKATAKHLLKSTTSHSDEMSNYFNNLRDLSFIDTSALSIGGGCGGGAAHQQHDSPMISREALSRASRLKRRSTINMMESKSSALEALIIKNFMSSIVAVVDNEKTDASASPTTSQELTEQLAVKLVQILVNNYSDLMRIPEDLVSSVKSKELKLEAREERKQLTAAANFAEKPVVAESTAVETGKSKKKQLTGYCSKISMDEYEKQRLEATRPHLATLLDGIIRDTGLSEHEKLLHLKRFREMHPVVFDDNLKMKKALNVLGLNETISASTNVTASYKHDYEQVGGAGGSSDSTGACSGSGNERRKLFLGNLTNSIKSRNLSSTLNQTTTFISSQMNTTSMAAKSMGFQKFFKKKKENLI